MTIPLTRERVLEIIAEEKQNLQDDLCSDSKKHSLGKKANLISKGLRVCCKKSDKEYTVVKKKKIGKNMMFILVDSEGTALNPMPAEQLLKGYRLD